MSDKVKVIPYFVKIFNISERESDYSLCTIVQYMRKWKRVFTLSNIFNNWESESDQSPCQSLQCLRSGSKDLSSPPCSLHTLPTNQINHTGTELSAWRPFEHICSIFETYFQFFCSKLIKRQKTHLSWFHVPFPSMIVFLTARHWKVNLFKTQRKQIWHMSSTFIYVFFFKHIVVNFRN